LRYIGLLIVVFASSARAVETPPPPPHWAFVPPVKPAIPTVAAADRVRTPIDSLVLANLESKGLSLAPAADRTTLLRRLYLDLTGLPPNPAEQREFLDDASANAVEKLVDRLLESPRFGERWAGHWLDVVRYAESNGYEADGERPHVWRYRDYVVASFNDDKPYDRFLREQLAGDLLAKGKSGPEATALRVASGMNRLGPTHVVSGNVDPEATRQEDLTEMVTGVSSAILGLTVQCARCHDHKFDPIPQRDFYRLEAFFAGSHGQSYDFASEAERKEQAAKMFASLARLAPIKAKIAAIDEPYRRRIAAAKKAALAPMYREVLDIPEGKRTPEQSQVAKNASTLLKIEWSDIAAALSAEDGKARQQLRDQQHALEAELPPTPGVAWGLDERDTAPPTHVLKRGEVKKKGAVVVPGFPTGVSTPMKSREDGERRLTRIDLADWLTQPTHPLTARVMVNRLWQHYFGSGLVETPNDFGTRSEPPTQPKLLDYLATELVSGGWKLKRIHRLIVLSAVYQQSTRSERTRAGMTADPRNRSYWKMNRKRLEGEAIRDSILSASGNLNLKVGGPMVRVPLEPAVYELIFTEGEPDGLWPVTPDVGEHTRRSLWLHRKRNLRLPILEAFDQPDTLIPCAMRGVSTHAPQALILMNGPFSAEQSRTLATSLLSRGSPLPHELVESLWVRVLGRTPTAIELATATQFLRDQRETIRKRIAAKETVLVPGNLREGADAAHAAALADLCLATFNVNEFVYVP